MTQHRISLPGSVVDWLHDQDLHRDEPGHQPGELEWRAALRGSEGVFRGRNLSYPMVVSADAATQLSGELRERADVQALFDDPSIAPSTLRAAASKILRIVGNTQ